MKMQKTKMYVSILAIMIAGQSYAAAAAAEAGDNESGSKKLRGTGSAGLADVLEKAGMGRVVAGFLDTPSLVALSMANKDSRGVLLEYSLPLAIATTDLTKTPINLSQIKAVLSPADALYLEAQRMRKEHSPALSDAPIRDLLQRAVEGGSKLATRDFYGMAYDLELGFTAETGRLYLEDRVAKGDKYAQRILNRAARKGKLGFDAETGRAYLEALSPRDVDAQKQLNKAAAKECLGFDEETGLAYLEARSDCDEHAQKRLVHAAFMTHLGFNNVTGFTYLKACAAKGDKRALGRIIEVLINSEEFMEGLDANEVLECIRYHMDRGSESARKLTTRQY